jgi:hypothetical protein
MREFAACTIGADWVDRAGAGMQLTGVSRSAVLADKEGHCSGRRQGRCAADAIRLSVFCNVPARESAARGGAEFCQQLAPKDVKTIPSRGRKGMRP